MTDGYRIRIRGQVQGVGFRPFVWRLATRMGLSGHVLNDGEGVLIHAAGPNLDHFITALQSEAPPLSHITAIETAPHRFVTPPQDFAIHPSQGDKGQTGVPPDAATCPDCLSEITDPTQRRLGYAFTNCTQCGPRFSILHHLPYDRASTTMAAFPICPDCAQDYANPSDRRFHAQPIACPACGPRVWLHADGADTFADPIARAAERLHAGQILAIKGIGGFHLACDARNADAVSRLRTRKRRPTKPFALMGTAAMIAAHARTTPTDDAALTSPTAPIVLLTAQATIDDIAPGLTTQGWMLPHTPLHHLLLATFGGPLIMTSGNLTGEPPAIGNEEALIKLAPHADAFLLHDRPIARRLDDSVMRITAKGPIILRRGRGLVPATLALPDGFQNAPQVVAYGGQTKSAICLLKGGQAMLSHHLGDLDDLLTWTQFQQADTDCAALFDHHPQLAACDLHPDYRSTRHATQAGLPVIRVQHHHAHLAACLADNLWPLNAGPVAGIILDGTGLGTDGTLWGGEVLLGDYRHFTRITSLTPAPLIGGDKAALDPYRNLLHRLDQAGLPDLMDQLYPDKPLCLLRQVAASGTHAPLSSSAGRLFDAFAAALRLTPDGQTYDGEAAMRLESLASSLPRDIDPYPMAQGTHIDPAPLFHAWARDRSSPAHQAARFHAAVAQAFADRARALVNSGAARAVALSGGCFQNAVLLEMTLTALHGLPVLIHRTTPPNDGGLALGQAVIAAAQNL
jgi:hydrogenase maturation protein HypF